MNDLYLTNDSNVISFNALYWVRYNPSTKKFFLKFYSGNKAFEFTNQHKLTQDDFEKLLDDHAVEYCYLVDTDGDCYYVPKDRFLLVSGGTIYLKALTGDIKDFDIRIKEYRHPNRINKEREEVKRKSIEECLEPEVYVEEDTRRIQAPKIDGGNGMHSFLYGD